MKEQAFKYDARKQSLNVIRTLDDIYELTPPVLQRIGAFLVLWPVIEEALDRIVWKLSNEDVVWKIPTTEGVQPSKKLERFFSLAKECRNDKTWVSCIGYVNDTLRHLIEVRNTLAHGHILPSLVGAGTVRNPGWDGAKRKRPSETLYYDENIMDILLAAEGHLYAVIGDMCLSNSFEEIDLSGSVEFLRIAAQSVEEVRFLAEAMNHERY